MASSLTRLFTGFDAFGHPFKMTHKGADTYQTRLGGFCSVTIRVLTLIMVVIALKSMLLMEDPEIISFARPLSRQEKLDLGKVNLAEKGLLFGLLVSINGKLAEIPPEVGRLSARYITKANEKNLNSPFAEPHQYKELVLRKCMDFFDESSREKLLQSAS